MDATIWIVLIVLALLAGAGAAWFIAQRRRQQHLRQRFGPEYERIVQQTNDPRQAEVELEHREKRVEQLHIRTLSQEDRTRFTDAWQSVQARFVDDPAGAIAAADRLIGEVMQTRGYPVGDFDQRAADISVDHPHVVENYRAAHEIAQRSERGEASTEDQRQAMIHYRGLFTDLLEAGSNPVTEVKHG